MNIKVRIKYHEEILPKYRGEIGIIKDCFEIDEDFEIYLYELYLPNIDTQIKLLNKYIDLDWIGIL